MRITTAADLAELAGGVLHGDTSASVGPDVVVDARRATPGSVFVAIPGEHVDGHDFTGQAAANGAAAVIATRVTDADIAHVVVDDSVGGLSRLASSVVRRAIADGLTVLAITGSSGKTSTKDVLAQVLEHAGPTVSPVGSFNNEIGVPLTACGVDERTRYLVSEMGARGIGHLRWLTGLIPPAISLVLNVGSAHLGEFGSVENIAIAKGELVEALSPDGWAVLNADDHRVAAMASRTRGRVAWFTRQDAALEGGLVVRARDVRPDDLQRFSFTLVVERPGVPVAAHPVTLRLIGSHHVSNAVAAAAAAVAAGMEPERVAAALSAAGPRSKWRMQLDERADGAAVLNDAYNANPESMAAALATLADLGRGRRSVDPSARTIAVLGDMLELGADSASAHRRMGRLAADLGINEVVAVGEYAGDIVAGATAGGTPARALERSEVAGRIALGAMDVVLVKASRGVALEQVADELLAGGPEAC